VFDADGSTKIVSQSEADISLDAVYDAKRAFESNRSVNHGRSTIDLNFSFSKQSRSSAPSQPRRSESPDPNADTYGYVSKGDYPKRCELCLVVAQNEGEWSTHLNGKRHREMVYRSTPKEERGAPPKKPRTERRAVQPKPKRKKKAKQTSHPRECRVCKRMQSPYRIRNQAEWLTHCISSSHLRNSTNAVLNKSAPSNPSGPSDPQSSRLSHRTDPDQLTASSATAPSVHTVQFGRGKRLHSLKRSADDLDGQPAAKRARLASQTMDGVDEIFSDDLAGDGDDGGYGDRDGDGDYEMEPPLKSKPKHGVKTEGKSNEKSKGKSNDKTNDKTNGKSRGKKGFKHFGSTYFQMITFEQPHSLNLDTAHCLYTLNLPRDHFDAALFQKMIDEIVGSKCSVDIQLYHNRHRGKALGFGLFYFEKRSDAMLLIKASNEKRLVLKPTTAEKAEKAKERKEFLCTLCAVKSSSRKALRKHKKGKKHQEQLKAKRLAKGVGAVSKTTIITTSAAEETHHIVMRWATGKDTKKLWTPITCPEMETDHKLEGQTPFVLISNLHWKCTLHHVEHVLNDLCSRFSPRKMDLDPRWMKLLEDEEGYPRGIVLVMFRNTQTAKHCVDEYNGKRLLGRKMVMEYSTWRKGENIMQLERRPKYDVRHRNDAASGMVSRVLLSNIKADCTQTNVEKYIESVMKTQWGVRKPEKPYPVVDVHLLHNLRRVCGGRCFVTFDSAKSAGQFMETVEDPLGEGNWMHNRSVVAKWAEKREPKDRSHLYNRTPFLLVGNFTARATEKDLMRMVNGNPEALEILVDDQGFTTGRALVRYKSPKEAASAYDRWMRSKEMGHKKQMFKDRRPLTIEFFKEHYEKFKARTAMEVKKMEDEKSFNDFLSF